MVFKYLGTGPTISAPVVSAAPSLDAINVGLPWRSVQPHCSSIRGGEWDWSRADQAMTLAQEQGLWVVVTLGGGPACTSARSGGYFEPRRKWRGEWSRFAGQVANRYGPGGAVPVVRSIEPWNEPNLDTFTGTARDYRTLFLRTERAVRRADPEVKTLAASAALCCEHAVRWLGNLYDSREMRRRGQAVSVHTYAPTPGVAVQRMFRARQVLPRGATLAITEHGWSTCPEPGAHIQGKCVSTQQQAAYMWQYFALVWDYAEELRVRSVFWFNGQDIATPESMAACPSTPKYFYGLWTNAGAAKPSLGYWEAMTGYDLPDQIPAHRILRGCPE